MAWAIHFEGEVYKETDLTLGDAERICKITGEDWARLHPLRSPTHLKACMAVFLTRKGEVVEAAMTRLEAMPLSDVLDSVKVAADPADEVDEILFEEGLPPSADET